MSALAISARLLLSYLLVAVLPLAGLAAFYLASFEASLRETVLANMSTIADKKAEQIDSYIAERLTDARLLSHRDSVRNGIVTLGQAFRSGGQNAPAYQSAARQLGDYLKSSSAAEDFYDLLLMDTAGNVVFSLTQEPDLGTNLRHGPYRDTQLAKGFALTMQTLQTHLTRFAFYAPSGNRPAAFLVCAGAGKWRCDRRAGPAAGYEQAGIGDGRPHRPGPYRRNGAGAERWRRRFLHRPAQACPGRCLPLPGAAPEGGTCRCRRRWPAIMAGASFATMPASKAWRPGAICLPSAGAWW